MEFVVREKFGSTGPRGRLRAGTLEVLSRVQTRDSCIYPRLAVIAIRHIPGPSFPLSLLSHTYSPTLSLPPLPFQFLYHSLFTLLANGERVCVHKDTKQERKGTQMNERVTVLLFRRVPSGIRNPASAISSSNPLFLHPDSLSLSLLSPAASTLRSRDPSDFNFVPCTNYQRKNSPGN